MSIYISHFSHINFSEVHAILKYIYVRRKFLKANFLSFGRDLFKDIFLFFIRIVLPIVSSVKVQGTVYY